MPMSIGGERFILGQADPNSQIEVGLELTGVPADGAEQFGKQVVGGQQNHFAAEMIEEPTYNTAQSMRDGGKTFAVNLAFITQLSPTQETAINNKSALTALTYREAVKLSGTEKHQVYYEIDIKGIQNATAHGGSLLIREAESAEVKYKVAQGEGKLSAQEVINLTPAAS